MRSWTRCPAGRRSLFPVMCAALFFTLGLASASAQTNAFGYTQSTLGSLDYVAPPAGSLLAGGFGVLGDDEEVQVTLPWTFPYYGVNYSSLWAVDNGGVRFDSGDIVYTNECLPTQDPFGFGFTGADIAVYWDDMDVSSGGGVHAWQDVAGGRFIVSWENVPMYGSFTVTDGGTFQLHLYPSGNIEVHFLDLDFDGAGVTIDDATSATIGMNDQAGAAVGATVASDALMYSCLTTQPALEGDSVAWTLCTDADLDGYGAPSCGGTDCDDTNPLINPGAMETCDDGIDDDCDGVDLVGDADADTYISDACVGGDDCDDTDPLINPGVDGDGDGWDVCLDCNDNFDFMFPGNTEICGDGIDQDCSGLDEPQDGDADGFDNLACGGNDCDDTDPLVNPGIDADADGDDSCIDCDDSDPTINSGANEVCDGIDNNCDGVIDTIDADGDGDSAPGCGGNDCDDNDPTVDSVTDVDLDGFATCDDCDDADIDSYPGAPEVCDGVDNDCDGIDDTFDLDIGAVLVTEAGSTSAFTVSTTATAVVGPGVAPLTDLDVTLDISHGWIGELDISLTSPAGTTVQLSSFNGGSGANFTGTVLDDEATTALWEGFPPYTGAYQPDGDLSDFDGEDPDGTWTLFISNIGPDPGTLTGWSLLMTAGDDADSDGAVDSCGDCDPTDPTIYEGAPEVCADGIDQDCDGSDALIDDDNDGYLASSCGGPDCDDSDPTINPTVDDDGDGADVCVDCDDDDPDRFPANPEICGDGLDQDCSGADDLPDTDGDLFLSIACGGDDCDDTNPALNPGVDIDGDGADACEDCNDFTALVSPDNDEQCNGVDSDCNGLIDDKDLDEDGYIDDGACGGEDCDDDAADVNPGIDADADGSDSCVDCDDLEPLATPGGEEICSDGIDNDCVGGDRDGDVDGDLAFSEDCGGDDCDDNDPERFPDAEEICDGVDRNCDGNSVREDDDQDGYLDWTCGGTDCDDTDPWAHPGVVERCNGLDDDCDGESDGPECDEATPAPDGDDAGCESSMAGGTGAGWAWSALLLVGIRRRRRAGPLLVALGAALLLAGCEDAPSDEAPEEAATCDPGDVLGHIENEPNTRFETDDLQAAPGALHISGLMACGNDGDRFIADLDWFGVHLLCGGDAVAELTWGGDQSDLDLEVYSGEGDDWSEWDRMVGEYSSEMEGPESHPIRLEAEEPIHLFVGCWDGEPTAYELWIRWEDAR